MDLVAKSTNLNRGDILDYHIFELSSHEVSVDARHSTTGVDTDHHVVASSGGPDRYFEKIRIAEGHPRPGDRRRLGFDNRAGVGSVGEDVYTTFGDLSEGSREVFHFAKVFKKLVPRREGCIASGARK